MKLFKTKKFKIIRIVLIIILVLYVMLIISRIDISKGTITNIGSNSILVTIEGEDYWFVVDNTLILDENNKKIPLNSLKIDDSIFILNYNWRGWVYQAVGVIPPELYNVWLIKVID